MRPRALAVVMAVVLCGSVTSWAAAQNPIDGVWQGTYTSTHSPNPTTEILIFEVVGNQAVGAYLSASQSAGTLVGYQSGSSYTFLVTQPVAGCPPASGTLSVTLSGGGMQYSFSSHSCQGTDNGKGTAQKIASSAGALSALKADANVPVAGLWNGVYTSTHSSSPTNETIFVASFGAVTKGIYVSDSGSTGILTGKAPSNPFVLADSAPSPPCPGVGVFEGDVEGNTMNYAFHAVDCKGDVDIGRGKAERAQ